MADGSFGTTDTTAVAGSGPFRRPIVGCVYWGGSGTSGGDGTLDSIRIVLDDAGANNNVKVALYLRSDDSFVDSCAGVVVDLGGTGIQKFDFVLGSSVTNGTKYYFMCTAQNGTYSILRKNTSDANDEAFTDGAICYGTAWQDPFTPTGEETSRFVFFEVFWSSAGGPAAAGQILQVITQ